jgi:hypothetical protein
MFKRIARVACLFLALVATLVGGGIISGQDLSLSWMVPAVLLLGFYSCPVGGEPYL